MGRDHTISKMGLKWGHLQHLHVSREMPTKHHGGEISHTLSKNSTCWAASLKCLYSNACSMGHNHEVLEICVQLPGSNLVAIMETWWDGSHAWSVEMERYRLLRKERMGRQGWRVALCVREQLEDMALCLGMDREPMEILRVRIKEITGKGGVIVDVCDRPPDQEEEVYVVLNGHVGAASHWQALVLMGDFNHPNTCSKDNTTGYKHSRRSVECIDDKFLTQVIEEPTRRGALLDLFLTNKEGLVGDVKVKDSLVTMRWGCSDHEMVEFRILRGRRKVKSNLRMPDLRRVEFGLLQVSAWKSPMGCGPGGKAGLRKLVNIQGSPPPSSRGVQPIKYDIRQKCLEGCVDEQVAPGQTQTQKGSIQRVATRTGNLGGTQRCCLSMLGQR